MELIFFTFCYVLSFAASVHGLYAVSGCILTAAAAALGLYYFIKDGRRICPPAVFSVSWAGGVGISCFKLSRLETDWELITWICFWLAFISFITGYKFIHGKLTDKKSIITAYSGSEYACVRKNTSSCESLTGSEDLSESDTGKAHETDDNISGIFAERETQAEPILYMMNILAAVSLISLIAEGCIIGYIPLFTKDMPHAYSYFHVSGLHYFTVSCVLLPALGCIYLKLTGMTAFAAMKSYRKLDVSACMLLGVFIPVLLVSRYQMLFGLMLAFFTLLIMNGAKINIRINRRVLGGIFISAAVLITLYVFITIERAHSVEYLNGIFEMKNAKMPIFISQPYIYIANNFDNFNCLVRELDEFTHGLRMLFPVFALTGLKFIYPELTAFPIFVTKEELTTVTLIYDSYYDFGIIGVVVFCMLLGAAFALLEHKTLGFTETAGKSVKGSIKSTGCFAVLLYAQLCIYLALSFFTTWFSNPTTWFYIGLTLTGWAFCSFLNKRRQDVNGLQRRKL